MKTNKLHLKLLFVHVPKAGGTSLNHALQSHFANRLYVDADGPANPTSQMNLDPAGFLARHHQSGYTHLDQFDAVTGHYWINKYDPLDADIRATVLRHPIQRTISHYFFWRLPLPVPANALRDYLLTSELDILQFANLPIIRWFYSRHIFRDTNMSRFDYIWDIASLQHEWHAVVSRLGMPGMPQTFLNTTTDQTKDYQPYLDDILTDRNLLARLEDVLSDDIRFYDSAMSQSSVA